MSIYNIREIFLTLQGEGGRAGARSVFVRFSGCNHWSGHPDDRHLGKAACATWCDTDFFKGDKMGLSDLVAEMEKLRHRPGKEEWCVFTGGEPSLQVDEELVNHLHRLNWKVAMETNGSQSRPWMAQLDWITVSPKRGGEFKLTKGSELKVVLPGAGADGVGWSDEELVAMGEGFWRKYVQPQDPLESPTPYSTFLADPRGRASLEARYQAHLKRCVDFVMAHPDWRVSIQGHKFMHLP